MKKLVAILLMAFCGLANAGNTWFFSMSGEGIAFSNGSKFLFDKNGEWIGWFAWNGTSDVADRKGAYLGTVVGNRLVHFQNKYLGYAGYPGYPGYAGYPGYSGYGGYQFIANAEEVVILPVNQR